MQSLFEVVTRLIASNKYFCKVFVCNNFGRDGHLECFSDPCPRYVLRILAGSDNFFVCFKFMKEFEIRMRLLCLQLEATCLQWCFFFTYNSQF